MTEIVVELDARAELGEGPRWHAEERRFYWVDIARNELHRFDPATGGDEVRRFDQPVGCFAFRDRDGLLLAMKDGCAILDDWAAEPVAFGEQVFAGKPHHRFNDGRTDCQGRFWVGSVNTAKDAHDAALYRLGPTGRLTEIEGGMLTCNGAAFSPDGTSFFHTDTPTHALKAYDFDGATGTLSNRRIIKQWPRGMGRPDGGSFDADGSFVLDVPFADSRELLMDILKYGAQVEVLAPEALVAAVNEEITRMAARLK